MPKLREAPERIVPGRNRSGSDIPKGRVVTMDPGNGPDAVELADNVADVLHAVTLEAIANGKNGDLAQGGLCIVEAGAALATEGVKLTVDGSGRVIASSADNQNIIGTNNTLAGQAGDFVEAFITAPANQRGA